MQGSDGKILRVLHSEAACRVCVTGVNGVHFFKHAMSRRARVNPTPLQLWTQLATQGPLDVIVRRQQGNLSRDDS
jgi:hypothetical protein